MKPRIKLARLRSGGSTSLELGWPPTWLQDPHGPDETRWGKVHGHIRCDAGEWQFRDESLTAREVVDLADWLAADPWPESSELSFIEPCLKFFAAGSRANMRLLNVRFIGEVSPPWIQGDGERVWRDGFTPNLEATASALRSFSNQLAAKVGYNPER